MLKSRLIQSSGNIYQNMATTNINNVNKNLNFKLKNNQIIYNLNINHSLFKEL